MNSIKPSMIALVIAGLGALIAIAGKADDSLSARASCAADTCGCELASEVPVHDMPPALCDSERCARHLIQENQPGNELYCIARNTTCNVKVDTVSLGCIDYLRFCRNDGVNLCHRGACTPADELMPETKCTRQLRQ